MATIEIMTTGRIELGPTGRVVAENVKRLRKEKGMSLRALSDALSELGRGLSQDAINKIENGAEEGTRRQIRRVDVDDLIVLAVALNVSPAALLLPLDDAPNSVVEITGAGEVPADVAWAWASNQRPLDLPDSGDVRTPMLKYQLLSLPPGRRWTGLTEREFFERLASWGAVDLDAIKRLNPKVWEAEGDG